MGLPERPCGASDALRINFTMQIMQCERIDIIAALIFKASKYFLVVIVLK